MSTFQVTPLGQRWQPRLVPEVLLTQVLHAFSTWKVDWAFTSYHPFPVKDSTTFFLLPLRSSHPQLVVLACSHLEFPQGSAEWSFLSRTGGWGGNHRGRFMMAK